MSEDHNNTILRDGYNFAIKYLKLHRKFAVYALIMEGSMDSINSDKA